MSKAFETRNAAAAFAAILLAACAARVFYAHGLPMNWDETRHLQLAKQISLAPDSFYLPWTSPLTNHPLGVVYVTAVGDWLGGGRVFPVRLAFVGLSLFGLAGLYLLASTLFGPRVALIALALGAADRHLVALSPVFLESPSVIFLAPWAMLLMHRCLNRGSARDWLLTGFTFGLGYWFSTVFLAMLPAFGLYVLLTGRVRKVLMSRWMYAGLAVMAAMVLSNVISDRWRQWSNLDRNVAKVGLLGLSPRMALLYLGDLLICLKDPMWIVQNVGDKMYSPVYVPCHWVMGIVYVALAAASLRYARDERIRLLMSVVIGFLVPVTLLDAREPWNEFTWGSCTVFAVISLTAFLLGRASTGKGGAVFAAGIVAYSAGALLWFLAGPKWGYFCPEWERAYVGRVLAISYRPPANLSPVQIREAVAQRRELTDRAIRRRSDFAMAWYFRGQLARSAEEREAAFRRSLELQPWNPPVLKARAADRMNAGQWEQAKELLDRLVAAGDPSAENWLWLAAAERQLGDWDSAVVHAKRAQAMKPEDGETSRFLYTLYMDRGDRAKAEGVSRSYAARHPFGPCAGYLELAEDVWRQGRPDQARHLLDKALAATPRQAAQLARIGVLLARLDAPAQAVTCLENAVRAGAADPLAHYELARLLEERGESGRAIECYERAIEQSPDFAEAHYRLGVLLTEQNRSREAEIHLQAARRLGFRAPGPDGASRPGDRLEPPDGEGPSPPD